LSTFIDFTDLKERFGFVQVIDALKLPVTQRGNQWRGACPACKSGGERALVITDGKAFFCFAAHKGGDQIALAAHVRNCSVKDAAAFIADSSAPDAEPSPKPEDQTGEGKSLASLPYLEHQHEAVLAIGFDPIVAQRLGIGYAPKGIMRGTVAVPVRNEQGAIQGYIGLEDPVRLPSDFTTNIVRFPKSA